MAYSKRIPPIKLMLNKKEYNNLIGVLTKNIEEQIDETERDLAKLTKEKLLKYSVPRSINDNIEIDIRLYINEAIDIISQFLLYTGNTIEEIDYFQVLEKVRENFDKSNDC